MTALTLATADDIDRLLPLVAAFHAEQGIAQDDETRRKALMPLLEGSPLGAVYLVGPRRAPIGYACLGFGWSLAFGGMDAFLDEIYIRPGVRRRGIGSEVLSTLPRALAGAGITAMHLEVRRDDQAARSLYERAKFAPREPYMLMTRRF